MKTIKYLFLGMFMVAGLASTTYAGYYYPSNYQNSYNNQQTCIGLTVNGVSYGCSSTNPSYYYTSGCYTYYYNGQTQTTSVSSYNCQQQTYNQVYSYPVSYQTQYVFPYNTYQFTNGSWYPSYNTNQNYYSGYTNTNYNYGYNYGYNSNTYSGSNCYWQNGYQVCY